MGGPKHLLPLGDTSMLQHQVSRLQSICGTVAVVGLAETPPGIDVACITDTLPGRGPVGGIFTALGSTRTEFNLFLACDLPLMPARFLEFLTGRALRGRAVAAIPQMPDGGFQPLCAVYRRAALPRVRASLAAGRHQAQDLCRHWRGAVVPWAEIARAGFSPRIFANINTPEDYEAVSKVV